jgi:hypothetical protein
MVPVALEAEWTAAVIARDVPATRGDGAALAAAQKQLRELARRARGLGLGELAARALAPP